MNARRKKAEDLIYSVMDSLDTTGANTAYYKDKFKKMSDSEFTKWAAKPLPIRFHTKPFVIEPTMTDAENALKKVGTPLLEKVALPYLYMNKNGEPVWSNEAMVIYIHVKKMKQFITKKNSTPASIENRDMKTGVLSGHDKGGKASDREMEAMAVMGEEEAMKEFSTYRADFMDAKSQAYQTIAATGMLYQKDLDISNYDSISKNALNAYLIGSLLNSNILNVDYMLPITLANKQRKVTREVE
jgi:hypothetical protein